MHDIKQIVCMSFNNIMPFVRNVDIIQLNPNIMPVQKVTYDYRITYIYGGKGTINIDSNIYQCKKGDLFFWRPLTKYIVERDKEDPLVIINVSFDFTQNHKDKKLIPTMVLQDNYNIELFTEIIKFDDNNVFNSFFYVEKYQQCEFLLLEMVNEFRMQKLYYAKRTSGLFLSFIMILARNMSIKSEQNKKRITDVEQIIEYIHKNYNQVLSNKSIGEKFSFHPNYINRLMVCATGISLHQYVLKIKIQKSIQLLNESNLTITQIAHKLGFADGSHFTKVFKKLLGCAPHLYKGM